jgi:hypothetical protein
MNPPILLPGGFDPEEPKQSILTPEEVIDQLQNSVNQFKSCDGCSPGDLSQLIANIKNAIKNTTPSPGFLDPCERWCKGFKDALKQQGGYNQSCVYESGCEYAFNVGLTGGHVVYRLVLCNGEIIYVDNGTVGGDDNMGRPSDIPTVIWTPGLFPFPNWTHGYTDGGNSTFVPDRPRGAIE